MASSSDADALMVRTTVLTYRWIDELQDAAYKTLGSIAGRAIGYLAPEVALGGAVVTAGLIETDALDRDGVAAYLSELAENNPELMDHVTSGGGGLLDGLQMRSVAHHRRDGRRDRSAGRARAGCARWASSHCHTDFGSALRDVAGGFVAPAAGRAPGASVVVTSAPRSIEELMTTPRRGSRAASTCAGSPTAATSPTCPAPRGNGRRLRLVGGDHSAYAGQVVSRDREGRRAATTAPRVMLVGSAAGRGDGRRGRRHA